MVFEFCYIRTLFWIFTYKECICVQSYIKNCEFKVVHLYIEFHSIRHCTHVFSPSGITFRSLLTSMVLFTSLWVGTNYSYSRALMYASATDVATLTSSSSAFIVLLSICILKEPILILKVWQYSLHDVMHENSSKLVMWMYECCFLHSVMFAHFCNFPVHLL